MLDDVYVVDKPFTCWVFWWVLWGTMGDARCMMHGAHRTGVASNLRAGRMDGLFSKPRLIGLVLTRLPGPGFEVTPRELPEVRPSATCGTSGRI